MEHLLSVCLIVRDEALDLPRCLASVRGVADEVVVVDTGSTDGTLEIAAAAGARVVHATWEDDFSSARNVALSHARGRWILVIDADEELEPESAARLRSELEHTAAAGLQPTVRNLTPPGDLVRWRDVRITRLFRSDPSHRYEGRIHEQIAGSLRRAGGRIIETDLVIIHHGYARPTAQGGSRVERNLGMLERMVRRHPSDAYARHQLGLTLAAAGRVEEGKRALERALEDGATSLSLDTRVRCQVRLAQLALGREDNEEAFGWALLTLETHPHHTIALYVVGVAAFSMGQLEAARAAFVRVLDQPDLAPEQAGDVELLITLCKQLAPV